MMYLRCVQEAMGPVLSSTTSSNLFWVSKNCFLDEITIVPEWRKIKKRGIGNEEV